MLNPFRSPGLLFLPCNQPRRQSPQPNRRERKKTDSSGLLRRPGESGARAPGRAAGRSWSRPGRGAAGRDFWFWIWKSSDLL